MAAAFIAAYQEEQEFIKKSCEILKKDIQDLAELNSTLEMRYQEARSRVFSILTEFKNAGVIPRLSLEAAGVEDPELLNSITQQLTKYKGEATSGANRSDLQQALRVMCSTKEELSSTKESRIAKAKEILQFTGNKERRKIARWMGVSAVTFNRWIPSEGSKKEKGES